MDEENGRRSYLLDGRRVRLRDLVDAGLLALGDELLFTRPRSGETHTATIGRGGTLQTGRRSFASPSAAASAAAGGGSYPGWSVWTTRDGTPLSTLRTQLLDAVAAEAEAEAAQREHGDAEDEERESALPRHEFLKGARQAAETGAPQRMTVRDLIRHWGATTRDPQVSQRVAADLDNHQLRTEPDFLAVSLDDEVDLTTVEPRDPEPADPPASAEPTVTVEAEVATAPPQAPRKIGMTLGNLVGPSRLLEWVKPTATIEEALTKMLVNDYSQLPVLKTKHFLAGAVTWQSIAQARMKDPEAQLPDAIIDAARHSYDDDLYTVLPVLTSRDFVVVANPHNEITGIVTTADVVDLYQERTQPFLLIGELDQELRQIIEAVVPLDKAQQVCHAPGRPPLTSFDDMSMGDYQRVLANPECWDMFGWQLDRATFIARIDELRKVRNDIAHFNPDGVPGDTVDKIRNVLHVIRTFGPALGN